MAAKCPAHLISDNLDNIWYGAEPYSTIQIQIVNKCIVRLATHTATSVVRFMSHQVVEYTV
jgi:hypothetical protein